MRLVHETIMRPTKPVLVTPEQVNSLRYPVLVSPKLDGIRFLIRNGFALSRKLEPIPNKHVQRMASYIPHGLEGELILGDPLAHGVYERTQSAVMAGDSDVDDLRFYVFDNWAYEATPFVVRMNGAARVVANLRERGHNHLHMVPYERAETPKQVLDWEKRYVDEGYEGMIIRYPGAFYKFGISTLNDGAFIKMKRFRDLEAEIIGVQEEFANTSEPKIDNRGYIKRPKRRGNRSGLGTLGSFKCRMANGKTFGCGSGINREQRAALWLMKEQLIGKWISVKYQELTPKGVPRFPTFLRFREEIDFDKELS